MADEGFSVEGLPGFRQLLIEAPDRLGEALYRGTRRSLGAFRREFLAQTPARIRGKGNAAPNSGSGRRPRTIGRSFRWEVTPDEESQVQIRPEEVSGEIFTGSKAALGLETRDRIKPKRGRMLAIPIALPGKPNTAANGGPKPSWRYFAKVYASKRGQYSFSFLRKPNGAVTVMAQRKGRRGRGRPRKDAPRVDPEPAFPIFYMTQDVENDSNRLQFHQTWDGFQREVDMRFEKEIDRVLKMVARERTGRRGSKRS